MPFSISTQSYLGLRPKTAGNFVFVSEPDWTVIPSKSGNDISREEIMQKITAQAEKDALSGDYHGRGVYQLEALYLSPVSPDRKALYLQGKKAIASLNNKRGMVIPEGSRTLIDYLRENECKTGLKRSVRLKSGIEVYSDNLGQLDFILDSDRKLLLSRLSNNEWTYQTTPAESKRKREFTQWYMTAYDSARKRLEQAQNNGGPPPDGKTLNILA